MRRGVTLDSVNCPLCNSDEEDIHHVLFRCEVATAVMRRVCRWWTLDWQTWSSFSDWNAWFSNVRFFSKVKRVLEGVFCVTWWSLWKLRNRTIFDASPPSRSEIFDDIVSLSFIWWWKSLRGEGGDDGVVMKVVCRLWWLVVVASAMEMKVVMVSAVDGDGSGYGVVVVVAVGSSEFGRKGCGGDDGDDDEGDVVMKVVSWRWRRGKDGGGVGCGSSHGGDGGCE
nr:RNA-directed DNA polymerase, eukaryota [Tanacetum cinerariifolium]